MRKRIPLLALLFVLAISSVPVWAAEDPVRLFMPDGQLRSHPVRVFVTADLSDRDEPQLLLRASHALTEAQEGEARHRKPQFVARHHTRVQRVSGAEVVFRGTLLVFDLSDYPIPFYKAAMRVTPALSWEQQGLGGPHRAVAVGDREVYLGNITGAVGWTLVLVFAVLAGIAGACRRVGGRALCVVYGPDEKISLARAQVAAWTVAIGSMLLVFGLIRLAPPVVPNSLVALMGLSLATGGINYVQVRKRHREALAEGQAPAVGGTTGGGLSELVRDAGGGVSISKAQMVFWTVLTLTLFVVKSLLEGNLWEVPWPMVVLMGMGQAGYLGPKLRLDGPARPGTERGGAAAPPPETDGSPTSTGRASG